MSKQQCYVCGYYDVVWSSEREIFVYSSIKFIFDKCVMFTCNCCGESFFDKKTEERIDNFFAKPKPNYNYPQIKLII